FIAVDPYLNESTRHATVILPPPSALQKSHYDIALLNFAVRNVANYSPAVLPLDDGQPTEWELLLRLAAVVSGEGLAADLDAADRAIARAMVASATKDPHGSVFERDPDELLAMVGDRRGPERLLDIMLRTGPYGDGFGTDPDGLTLGVLEANPHGVDLGPLEGGRIPDLLRTPTGLVDLAPEMLRADLARLDGAVTTPAEDELVLIGRRHVRSNNSWMHNVRVLTKGRNRCTLQVHPDDADRLGLSEGAPATVRSRVGEVAIDVEVTDEIRPGVVSIPHGFGQNLPGVRLRVAQEYRGINTNVLTDEQFFDPVSGNIALNGVPVTVTPS
ncbi:MAG: molybdopterin oxidoreductase family protein, partial [Ilumatobacter sp.]|nr:molybdopterin oxidoreductase family protein [Ilumatobacter sp.]